MQKIESGTVTIHTEETGDDVIVTIEDDGVGTTESDVEHLLEHVHYERESVGLANTNRRLLRHYGTGLTIQREVGKGTTVSFIVRAEKGKYKQ